MLSSSYSIRTARRAKNPESLARLLQHIDKRIARPSLKAFILAFLYVALPKLLAIGVKSVKKGDYRLILLRYAKIIKRGLHPLKFPMFAANLIAGINVLEPLVYQGLKRLRLTNPVYNLFVSTLISSLISSLTFFPLFQRHIINRNRHYTLDLTLLVVTRAADTVFTSTMSRLVPASVAPFGDGLLFIIACYFIMYSWFFTPNKLDPNYCKWITSAANMDPEIVEMLKGIKDGDFDYNRQKIPEQDVLAPYCRRYNEDIRKGNLNINQPIDCYVVHAFQTKSCEVHALWRFYRGILFAYKIYGPINAFMLLFPKKNVKYSARIIKALVSTARSSCFLGTFIGLYWYAVCLARTRLFPLLFPHIPKTRFDNTVAPAFGAFLCGFSSFVENAKRRKELALFVAPKALGTLVSSNDSEFHLKVETLAFSVSMAILVAFCKSDPSKVRGIFGLGIQQVFSTKLYT